MTYPAPTKQASSGSLLCTYADPTSGANLVMVITSAPGTTPSVLQAVAQSQATAQHVTASSVSGLGDAAYSMTLDDAATNSLHVATSIVLAVKGSVSYDVTAEASLTQVEAVVRLLLG
jgi:MinD superfamily P-loop ATPase